jgi:hypothetical protein
MGEGGGGREEGRAKGAGFDGITAVCQLVNANVEVETGHGEIIAESRVIISETGRINSRQRLQSRPAPTEEV